MYCLLLPSIVTPPGFPDGASVAARTRQIWLGFRPSAEDAPEKPCRLSGRGVSLHRLPARPCGLRCRARMGWCHHRGATAGDRAARRLAHRASGTRRQPAACRHSGRWGPLRLHVGRRGGSGSVKGSVAAHRDSAGQQVGRSRRHVMACAFRTRFPRIVAASQKEMSSRG
jgi:hypothetical protein